MIWHRKATIDNAMRLFLERYSEVQKDKVIKKPISKALYDTWKYFDSIERERKAVRNEKIGK